VHGRICIRVRLNAEHWQQWVPIVRGCDDLLLLMPGNGMAKQYKINPLYLMQTLDCLVDCICFLHVKLLVPQHHGSYSHQLAVKPNREDHVCHGDGSELYTTCNLQGRWWTTQGKVESIRNLEQLNAP